MTFIKTTYTAKQHAEVRASISPKIGCGGRSVSVLVSDIDESERVTRITPRKLDHQHVVTSSCSGEEEAYLTTEAIIFVFDNVSTLHIRPNANVKNPITSAS